MSGSLELQIVDDDEGNDAAPKRDILAPALRAAGFVVREPSPMTGGATRLVAVFGDVLGGKGRVAYSPATIAAANAAVAEAVTDGRRAVIVQFGHPRLAHPLCAENVVTAWSGEQSMQEAAARWLSRKRG